MTLENGIYKITSEEGTYSFYQVWDQQVWYEGKKVASVNTLENTGCAFERVTPVAPQTLKEMQDKIVGITLEMNEIEQTLGSALDYPRYVDDPANFPRATAKDGVCVGELTPIDLSSQAAKRIEALKMELEQTKNTLLQLCDAFAQKVNEQESDLIQLRAQLKDREYQSQQKSSS